MLLDCYYSDFLQNLYITDSDVNPHKLCSVPYKWPACWCVVLSSPEGLQWTEDVAQAQVQALPLPARRSPLLSAWKTTASEGECTPLSVSHMESASLLTAEVPVLLHHDESRNVAVDVGGIKEQFTQDWKFSHYLLTSMPMQSRVS